MDIDTLINNGQLAQAANLALKSLEDGVVPKQNVLKYLLKCLAQEGNVEKIQQFGKHITDSVKRRVTYDDKLTLAMFLRGAGSQHVDGLYEAVQAAKTPEDLEVALKKFPRSNALEAAVNNDELLVKCKYVLKPL